MATLQCQNITLTRVKQNRPVPKEMKEVVGCATT